MDHTYTDLATAILVAHQRTEDSGCLCGKLKIGASWAAHVTHVLNVAGALK